MMGHGMMHSGEDAAAAAVDPVCGMKVDPETAPSATYEGKTYYFCSAEEKAQFEKDPQKYLRRSAKS
ncbi:MAG: YHS domain-containing protein [Acidobacteria bacterium]|nr:YHS domain-containing protein [Acidobacteriota bacterium]